MTRPSTVYFSSPFFLTTRAPFGMDRDRAWSTPAAAYLNSLPVSDERKTYRRTHRFGSLQSKIELTTTPSTARLTRAIISHAPKMEKRRPPINAPVHHGPHRALNRASRS